MRPTQPSGLAKDAARQDRRRVGRQTEVARRDAGACYQVTEGGDHRTVVGAEAGRLAPGARCPPRAALFGQLAQPGFAATPPTMSRVSVPGMPAGVDRLRGQHVDHRLLERRRRRPAYCSETPSDCWASTKRAIAVFSPENENANRCLSRLPSNGRGNATAVGSPRCRRVRDRRSARVAEPEQPGDLVEALPRGVIERVAEVHDRVRRQVLDQQE